MELKDIKTSASFIVWLYKNGGKVRNRSTTITRVAAVRQAYLFFLEDINYKELKSINYMSLNVHPYVRAHNASYKLLDYIKGHKDLLISELYGNIKQ